MHSGISAETVAYTPLINCPFVLQGPGSSGAPPSGGFSPGQSQVSTQDQEKVGATESVSQLVVEVSLSNMPISFCILIHWLHVILHHPSGGKCVLVMF